MEADAATVAELSGEHPNLPLAELLGALDGLGLRPASVGYEPRTAVLEPPADSAALARRLALTRRVGPLLLRGPLDDVLQRAAGIDLGGRTFRVRAVDYRGGREVPALEATLGEALASRGAVDLETPEVDLRLACGHEARLFRVEAAVDRAAFEERKGRHRPFSLPVSLHPRLARALVNLTGVRPGATLLDPFCGTGGLLLEAALVGAVPVGADLRTAAVEGCRENLRHFGVEATLHALDVGDLPAAIDEVDAIATDPPYGRSATTSGEPLPRLMDRAFRAFASALREGGRLAISLPEAALMDRGRRHLRLVEWHDLPVHASLTRTFCLFEKG